MTIMSYIKILCQTNINDTITPMNPENATKIPEKENFFKEIIKFTIIALIVVIPIRTYIAQPFIVSGPSMDPTFETNQYLIVDQVSYRFNEPKRNDVIIFKYPRDPKTYFIKRIIGLPGDTVIAETGKITIKNKDIPEGIKLNDSYIAKEHRTSDNFEITLGPSEYFVMGDNRAESSDSRAWGPVDRKYIVGRPFLRLFPLSKAITFPGV